MTETTVGREPVQIVEIVQPLCSRTFGVAPCTATGTVDTKCYNTRATCRDTPNFLLGTPLSLYFSSGKFGELRVKKNSADTANIYIIPSLLEVSTTPIKINLSGADPDAGGLGNRAVCNVKFIDHPHTDRIVDPYILGRTFTPMNSGSFWTKWMIRNKYRQNIIIKVYEGYIGQALDDMVKRTYFLQSVQGPDSDGRVTVQGKDIIAKLEERKSQAPVASPGKLGSDITEVQTSFDVIGAITSDYPFDQENIILWSEEFDNASWTKSASSISANVTYAPDGSLTADKLVESVTLANHFMQQTVAITADENWTFSISVKAAERTLGRIQITNGANSIVNAFDLTTGVVTSSATGTGVVNKARIKSLGGGWYRLSISGIGSAGSTSVNARVILRDAGGLFNYTGDGSSGFFVWGAQFEIGIRPKSYFKTTSAALTVGTVRIGDELMKFTSVASITNGVTLTIQARGTDNTIAVTHSSDDKVQSCLRYINIRPDDLVEDQLDYYGGIDSQYLDLVGWNSEVSNYASSYLLNPLITEPTSVSLIVSEVQEQCLINIWWDERLATVKMKAIRGVDEDPQLISAENNIHAGTFELFEKPRERASQVWIFFDQIDYVKDPKSIKAYRQGFIVSNIESESSDLYGEPSIRKIFARFLTSESLAATTASKISVRYVDVPSTCSFKMDAKDRAIWVGDTIKISHYLDVDQYGNRRIRNWTVVSAEEVIPGELIAYTCEDTTLYGKISYVMATGAADYPGATLAPFKNCYVGNSLGLLSDGSTCGRIN